MNRKTAVTIWRAMCGSDMGVVTDRMLEEFARRIEAAERERCAKIVDAMCDVAARIREPNVK